MHRSIRDNLLRRNIETSVGHNERNTHIPQIRTHQMMNYAPVRYGLIASNKVRLLHSKKKTAL